MANDPVCGMTIEIDNAVADEEYQGTTQYFCSDTCHRKFLADPAQYVQAKTTTDPVCRMEVSADSDYFVDFAGTRYNFCCESCLNKFDLDPALYTHAPAVKLG